MNYKTGSLKNRTKLYTLLFIYFMYGTEVMTMRLKKKALVSQYFLVISAKFI